MKLNLSSLLQSVRIARIDAAFLEFSDNGGAYIHSNRRDFLHLCVEGSLWVDNGDENEAVQLHAGDYMIQIGNQAPRLRTDIKTACRTTDYFQAPKPVDSPSTMRFGVGPRAARTLTGAFMVSAINPIFRALPRTIVVRKSALSKRQFLNISPNEIADAAHGAGGSTFITSIFDILFMQAARSHIEKLLASGVDIHASVQKLRIPIALTLIHTHPDRDWTLQNLADEVGVSRSSFAAEFHKSVGMPLFQYLTQLRMNRAADILRWQPVSVADAAYYVGYKSLAAFSRAFRQFHGISPSAFQRSSTEMLDASMISNTHWSTFLSQS